MFNSTYTGTPEGFTGIFRPCAPKSMNVIHNTQVYIPDYVNIMVRLSLRWIFQIKS